MNEKIAQLNVVIAELNLASAKLAAGAAGAELKALLKQAQLDLAAAVKSIVGQSGGEDDTTG